MSTRRSKQPDLEVGDEVEVEELVGTLIEVDIQQLSQMIAGQAHFDTPIVAENQSLPDGKYRMWINTPMGFTVVDKVYIQVGDIVAEEDSPSVTN